MRDFIHFHFHRLKKTEKVWLRRSIGILLCIGGILGFLPVLGYWMFPLGIALLSVDWAWARRLYRRMFVAWGRQYKRVRRWLRQDLGGATPAARRAARSHGRHSGP
jgi:hypothetical protein